MTETNETTITAETIGADAMAFESQDLDPKLEYYLNGAGRRTGTIRAPSSPLKIRIRAYATFVGTGSGSEAGLRLLYNGDPAGEMNDRRFNRANLQVLNYMVLDPNQEARFAIETRDNHALERYYGLEAWISLA